MSMNIHAFSKNFRYFPQCDALANILLSDPVNPRPSMNNNDNYISMYVYNVMYMYCISKL